MKWPALICIGVVLAARGAPPPPPALVPAPQTLEWRKGAFHLTTRTTILTDGASRQTAGYLAATLRPATGLALPVNTNGPAEDSIRLTTRHADAQLGPEGYELIVNSNSVVIQAPAQAGLFYGCQTLRQLLPPEIFSTNQAGHVAWEIPCARIWDRPRFAWRGLMLDVSRHFFNEVEVERILDLMALHKLNTFHWHLVDDQGWRIEIKKYPRLTQIGAWRKHSRLAPRNNQANAHPAWAAPSADKFGPDGRYGGFYTQAQVRQIVAYAAARHITIVPEIEMPGHATAALAAYPQFSCFGGPYSTDVGVGIHNAIFCAGNPGTYKFLQDVLDEIFELFPGKCVHIGGDEVPTDNWKHCPKCQALMRKKGFQNEDQLQSYFMQRMAEYVVAHGRTPIGWTGFTLGALPPGAAVMDWIGGGRQAALAGHDAIMTPVDYCYFDQYQSLDTALEPRAQNGFLLLDKVYRFEPVPPRLPPWAARRILGGQANLWTEHIASLPHAEYMLLPRLCALAEADWSPENRRDWNDFSRRMKIHLRRLAELNVNFRRDESVRVGAWAADQLTSDGGVTNLEWDVSAQVAGPGQYRVSFEFLHGSRGLGIESASLLEDGKPVARDDHIGFAGHRPDRPVYVLNLRSSKAGARYALRAHVVGAGSTGVVSWVFRPE